MILERRFLHSNAEQNRHQKDYRANTRRPKSEISTRKTRKFKLNSFEFRNGLRFENHFRFWIGFEIVSNFGV